MHKERSQSLDGCEFDDTAQDEEVMAVDTLIQHREQGLCPPDLESLEWDIEITGAQQAELLRVLLDIMQGYHDLGFQGSTKSLQTSSSDPELHHARGTWFFLRKNPPPSVSIFGL